MLHPQESVLLSIRQSLMQSGYLLSPVPEVDNIDNSLFFELARAFWAAADGCWSKENLFSGSTYSMVLGKFVDLADFLTGEE